ncbi:hypothetical protein [Salipiger mucosus]|uniref:Uncharacterized protein n=1 Tax=Salipiger mucosus DSM 16094 TaxID=1123237 RepID=S9QJA9_9RHOB|nr:hypothetical protein [Salipiger mucosus]EPX79643.1 hypothetical protein Salmuc_05584 [Salipiger mucosus DSM 16094]
MLELEAHHTHLYPGAMGRVLSGRPDDGPVMLTLADGVRATGRLEGDRLLIEAHRTGRGTRIAAKAWRVAFDDDGFRVTARDTPPVDGSGAAG